jgi:hypothetical protein
LVEARKQLTIEQEHWQGLREQIAADRDRCISEQQRIELLQEQLNTRGKQIEAADEQLRADRERFETAAESRHQEQALELERLRQELESERAAWQRERAQVEAELSTRRGPVENHTTAENEDFDARSAVQIAERLQAIANPALGQTGLMQARRDNVRSPLAPVADSYEQEPRSVHARETSSPAIDQSQDEHPGDVATAIGESMASADVNRDAEPHPDIFARLRALSLLKDDEQDDVRANVNPSENTDAHSPNNDSGASNSSDSALHDAAESERAALGATTTASAAQPHGVVPARTAVSPPNEHSEEEESIDDYMARLLNRVRGNADERPAKSGVAESRAATVVSSRTSMQTPSPTQIGARHEAVEIEASIDQEAPKLPRQPVQLVARSTAPESTVNLAAMRELANMTARVAIAKHSHGKGSIAILKRFVGAGIATCSGAALLYFGHTAYPPLQLAGMACMVAATVCFWQVAARSRKIRNLERHSEQRGGSPLPIAEAAPESAAAQAD